MDIQNLIDNLTPESLEEINEAFAKKQKNIPTYSYSQITFKDLKKLFDIKNNMTFDIFDKWFNNNIELKSDDIQFLLDLIKNHEILIDSYKEEDLKVKFITPILNRIQFLDLNIPFRDFYEEQLTYKTDHFILTGVTDFLIAKGLEFPDEPYFFIQEFKKSIKNDDPRPQLLAELISAIELNQFSLMKGAYIVGAIWHFVILEKIETNKYQYSISKLFNATNIEDLKSIYQNLLFVKNEIIEITA
ncbi:hypothetical protein [Candidatus Parabeggiatoa sp. HSG14]|uniref:hypothetical protein n=1 Tax=Candidatus Parabeggiatoa sp. HSG14 TaxID=3055593 RepID=UPI0025A73A1B|nr:hypothetical protein [Thiotrichales bacterium HSG14]